MKGKTTPSVAAARNFLDIPWKLLGEKCQKDEVQYDRGKRTEYNCSFVCEVMQLLLDKDPCWLDDEEADPIIVHELRKLTSRFLEIEEARCSLEDAEWTMLGIRIKVLLGDPRFIRSPYALPVLIALRDTDEILPFPCFGWHSQDQQSNGGMNAANIKAFERILDCQELWSGKGRVLRRLLTVTIGRELRALAMVGFVKETVTARMKLLTWNSANGSEHSIWCSTAFRPGEVSWLKFCGIFDWRLWKVLRRIKADGMVWKQHKRFCGDK